MIWFSERDCVIGLYLKISDKFSCVQIQFLCMLKYIALLPGDTHSHPLLLTILLSVLLLLLLLMLLSLVTVSIHTRTPFDLNRIPCVKKSTGY